MVRGVETEQKEVWYKPRVSGINDHGHLLINPLKITLDLKLV